MSEILLELHFLRSDKKYEKELALGEEILAGKSSECDLNLTDYFGKNVPIKTMKHISRKHFKIAQQKEGVVIFDLSMNGTRVNDEDLSRSCYPKVLHDQDIITLANKKQFQINVGLTTQNDPERTRPVKPGRNQEGTIPVKPGKVTSGFYFDEANSQFIVDGYAIPKTEFTDSQYEVLKLLSQNVGKVYSSWTIAKKTNISLSTVPQIIKRLRKVIEISSEKSGKKYIKNKRLEGYYIPKV